MKQDWCMYTALYGRLWRWASKSLAKSSPL